LIPSYLPVTKIESGMSATMLMNNRAKGIVLVVAAALLWGLSSAVTQNLFRLHGMEPEWLVSVRLLIAGGLLLGQALILKKPTIFLPFRSVRSTVDVLIFSIFGFLLMQYPFYLAIDASNAATATILQFVAPALIACYVALRDGKAPGFLEISMVILAFAGIFLIATHGNVNSLALSPRALFWGLASAIGLMIYTLQPKRLLQEWGSVVTVGWGMFIAGVLFSFYHPPWRFAGEWSPAAVSSLLVVIVCGTFLAFLFFSLSLKYISPVEASVLCNVEPLFVVGLSVVWLNVRFVWADWLGALAIITTVVVLSLVKEKPARGGVGHPAIGASPGASYGAASVAASDAASDAFSDAMSGTASGTVSGAPSGGPSDVPSGAVQANFASRSE